MLSLFFFLACLFATTSQAGDISGGIGVGAQYSGAGFNIGLIDGVNRSYFSFGCSEIAGSTNNIVAQCGPGIGYTRSFNTNHTLGFHLGTDLNTDGKGKPIRGAWIQYIYYIKPNQRGWNFGLAPGVKWENSDANFNLYLNGGYQW